MMRTAGYGQVSGRGRYVKQSSRRNGTRPPDGGPWVET